MSRGESGDAVLAQVPLELGTILVVRNIFLSERDQVDSGWKLGV